MSAILSILTPSDEEIDAFTKNISVNSPVAFFKEARSVALRVIEANWEILRPIVFSYRASSRNWNRVTPKQFLARLAQENLPKYVIYNANLIFALNCQIAKMMREMPQINVY
jgi:hypothetical protein